MAANYFNDYNSYTTNQLNSQAKTAFDGGRGVRGGRRGGRRRAFFLR